ncbi:MAG: nucleotidyltransferase family protein [Gammaproteobacteria bacterium]|nr:nucleotidyltransferase family protein [Gammaproteobacteria bacterium]
MTSKNQITLPKAVADLFPGTTCFDVRAAAQRFSTFNPTVFGSVLHGEDREGGDLDLLVDPLPSVTLLDLGGLQVELEEMLGVPVDLPTPGDLPPKYRQKVLSEARPV